MTSWPDNKTCSICKTQFEVSNIIQSIPITIEIRNLIYLFFIKKLNRDITLNILQFLKKPSYIHSICLSKKEHNEKYKACWCLLDNNKMYISNLFYSYH